MSIGVVINTKNASQVIREAIASVQFADQLVVVDMESQDETPEIAKSLGAQVFTTPDVGYVEPARNLALSKIHTDWTLVLDADERVPTDLKERLIQISTNNPRTIQAGDAYKLPRKNMIFGQPVWHTGWWPDYVLRFFKTGIVDWPESIHAQPLVKGTVVTAPAEASWAIEHYNYQTVAEFLDRLNHYTTIQANQDSNQITTNPPLTSLFHELFRRLFMFDAHLDGERGISLAVLQALSEAVSSIKQREKFKRLDTAVPAKNLLAEINSLISQMQYWRADLAIKENTGLIKWFWRFRRKFRL